MSWQTVTILVPDESLKEAVVGEFSGDSIAGVWERPHESGCSEVVFYFARQDIPPLVEARIYRIFERNGYPVPSIEIGEQANVDWTTEWRKGFSSFALGKRFRVVPGWEEPPPGDSRIALRIDPGMAFGTGTHETTQMVIEILETVPLEMTDVPVLDLGTGSGILTIAARKLGANRVVACDIDADAVFVARSNFGRNHVVAELFVGSVDAVPAASVGLVLANLTSEVIVQNLDEIARVLRPSGLAVLSGVLESQAAYVEAEVASSNLHCRERRVRGEWASFQVQNGN